jgi:hypothetical protein
VAQGIYMSGCSFAQSEYGIWCDYVSGLNLVSCELLDHAQHGFVCYPQPGRSCESFRLTNLEVDSCGGTGFYLGSGGGNIDLITMSNCWSGSNNIGIEVAGAPNGNRVRWSGGDIVFNRTQAVRDYGATSLIVTSDTIIG